MSNNGSPAAALSAQLLAASVRALAAEYDRSNRDLFGGALRRPPILLSESEVRLGQWSARPAEISISRQLLTGRPWPEVVDVLKHEMAHQFVSQVLHHDERPHGPVFARVCRERGIDSAAAGIQKVGRGAASGGLLKKIAALLSLAQSSNVNEAEAAMGAAQRLMLKHNLALEQVRESRRYCVAHLGQASGRIQAYERVLASILGQFFFVEVLWVDVWRVAEGKTGSILEICGTAENVSLAEYVYQFLSEAGERLWRSHKLESGVRLNRDRRRFISGVMSGFSTKLAEQTKQHQLEGLVWLGDPGLDSFFSQRNPRVQMVSFGCGTADDAYLAGRAAGHDLVLHRGVQGGAHSTERRRLSS